MIHQKRNKKMESTSKKGGAEPRVLVSEIDDDTVPTKKMFEPNYLGINLDRNNIIISGQS